MLASSKTEEFLDKFQMAAMAQTTGTSSASPSPQCNQRPCCSCSSTSSSITSSSSSAPSARDECSDSDVDSYELLVVFPGNQLEVSQPYPVKSCIVCLCISGNKYWYSDILDIGTLFIADQYLALSGAITNQSEAISKTSIWLWEMLAHLNKYFVGHNMAQVSKLAHTVRTEIQSQSVFSHCTVLKSVR